MTGTNQVIQSTANDSSRISMRAKRDLVVPRIIVLVNNNQSFKGVPLTNISTTKKKNLFNITKVAQNKHKFVIRGQHGLDIKSS